MIFSNASSTYNKNGQLMVLISPRDMAGLGQPERLAATSLRCAGERHQGTLVLIEPRTIIREGFAQSLAGWGYNIQTSPDINTIAGLIAPTIYNMVILSGPTYSELSERLAVLHVEYYHCPAIAIFDDVSPGTVFKALEIGARGVLSTNSSVSILHSVIQLIRLGGTYVPPDCLITARRVSKGSTATTPGAEYFTPKQIAIISAVHKGHPNKTIAYDLCMCESTVKHNIQNIMKKMGVSNRTELSSKAESVLGLFS